MSNLRLHIRFSFLVLSAILYSSAYSYSQEIPKVFTHTSLSKAMRDSKYGGKPVFAFVFAEWSIPCQRMMDSTFMDKKVIHELQSDYECVALEARRRKRFTEEYDIHIFPTMLVMDWTGEVIIRFKGYKSPEEFIKTIDKTRSSSRYLKQSIDSLIQGANADNILTIVDSVKYFKDDYAAKNLVKKYLDHKSTDWRHPNNMFLIKEYFAMDKKYLKFLSKYHFKFYERFDSLAIKENIAFHVFINSLKTDSRGRAKFEYKPVKKWFRKHKMHNADKLENFVKIKYLLWGRGPSIRYSVNLLKDYPETNDENVLYASTIRLLISNSRRRIDYDELISSVKQSIKEDGTFWRYDLLSLLYYKIGNKSKSDQAISTAKNIAAVTNKMYDPTLPYIIDAIEN